MSTDHRRREFFRKSARGAGAAAALSMFPPAIRKALAIEADRRTGTLRDVEHIVVLTQENRAFDHYFGTLAGVRGFGDRFPIPVADAPGMQGRTVWYQRHDGQPAGLPAILAPQHNDTAVDFRLMRTAGTPHLYPDAQDAWDGGRMTHWPQFKKNASMVYYAQADLPFQFALANAFTVCDAYHCSLTGGTNPNRCFIFTGTNHGRDDPARPDIYNGPALDNSYNTLKKGAHKDGYTWMTYAERLQDAGVSWQVYQDNEFEFYALNPLFGFKAFRQAHARSVPAVLPERTERERALYERGIRTRNLDALRADVMADRLPQVSWICAPSSASEHPQPSSPAQGAAYTAQVLDALTANPRVWSRTVLILNFDENDGFFDHMPPPAPPSYARTAGGTQALDPQGASTVDASDDYLGDDVGGVQSTLAYRHHPYGMGPRVPMYVISPWSRGGWVNSEVFDHTSVLRFIARRFGVDEPNISPWRRAVAGDLMSCFDFATPNQGGLPARLPDTAALDGRSRSLSGTTVPIAPAAPELPVQAVGTRRSRALPYELHVDDEMVEKRLRLRFSNTGGRAAVFHVYDIHRLDALPRRYTVEPGRALEDVWLPLPDGRYSLWVLGPNGFHRHFAGTLASPPAPRLPITRVRYAPAEGALVVTVSNPSEAGLAVTVTDNAYFGGAVKSQDIPAGQQAEWRWPLAASHCWYDFTLGVGTAGGTAGQGYARRFAGRMETGAHGISDPAMGGPAQGGYAALT
ncbi:phospholipase C, phosphocholine-specific [Bordetella genomosp. 8]|uniref:phospholipase C n=1 Tax=Bordetella genomosp. 8 TaxID=1416806 RepID=A0A1W6YM84_9BORD|nr:phospholipase C, phosphocholine-specific [Bordetella genomosp. 8]ARP82172.1 phospholipase C, phosphocholine-specific [Bordetella genomosp. 8]